MFVPSLSWQTAEFCTKTQTKHAVFFRYFGRAVGWYTRGGFVDECGHNHTSGYFYNWHGLSVFNEDEHGLSPEGGVGYSRCFDVIAKEVHRINPTILLVGPETVAGDGNNGFLTAFMNASNHSPEILVDENTVRNKQHSVVFLFLFPVFTFCLSRACLDKSPPFQMI